MLFLTTWNSNNVLTKIKISTFSMQVEYKDQHIRFLCKSLEESENQHKEAMSRHFIMLDNMINNHDVQMEVLLLEYIVCMHSYISLCPTSYM